MGYIHLSLLGVQRLRQTGTLDVIKKKWTTYVGGGSPTEGEVLTVKQTAIVFIAYSAILCCCGVIFVGELLVCMTWKIYY